MRLITALLSISLMLLPALSLAKEPANLAHHKQSLIRYHDSGQYESDIHRVVNQAIAYLQKRLTDPAFLNQKPAIVLDIDETSISNYPNMVKLGFGGTMDEIRENETKGNDPAIAPTLKLYRFAKEHKIAVFFVTGRHEFERTATISNLEKEGYSNWDGLILRSKDYEGKPAADFKTAMRKHIEDQGHHIVLNMGDQLSDLRGEHADKVYKLPNPYYEIA